MQVWSLSQEDPMEKEMATHSTILAWEILWTEESGSLQSTVSQEANTTERLNNNIGGGCIVYWLLENRWIFYVLIYVSFTDDGLLACILQYSWHILLVNIVKCLFFWVHSSTADLKRMLFPKNCFSSILLFLICFQL